MRKAAFGLYLLFVVSWFLHLPARLPVLGLVRFDLLLMCSIAALQLMSVAEDDPKVAAGGDSRTRRLILALTAYCVVSIPFVEWPGSVIRIGLPNFVKATVFYWFTAGLVTTSNRLRWLVAVFMASQVFRVLEPTYLHFTQGYWGSVATMAGNAQMYRLSGAPFDIINPNGLAFVSLTALCFLHYVATLSVAGTVAYLAVLPVMLYALVLTGSRSGMLALGIVAVSIWLKSRRKAGFGMLMAVAVVAAMPYLSNDLADRYASIFSSNTRNAVTAEDRTEGFLKDIAIAMRRPLFGHGLGTSVEVNANFRGVNRPSHNLYSEAAEEIGFVGMFLLVAVIASTVVGVWSSHARMQMNPDSSRLLSRVAASNQVWLAMNILFSLASYGLSSYEWYLAAGLATVVQRCAVPVSGKDVVEAPAETAAPLLAIRVPKGQPATQGVRTTAPGIDPHWRPNPRVAEHRS